MSWITEAELDEKFGEDEIDRVADLDHDGARDPGVVGRAILNTEGRIRSRLLTRFRPDELPAQPTAALRRISLDLTWWELHKPFEQVPDSVKEVRDDAKQELADLVAGTANLDLPGSPPSDNTRPSILTSPSREDRMTLANLE